MQSCTVSSTITITDNDTNARLHVFARYIPTCFPCFSVSSVDCNTRGYACLHAHNIELYSQYYFVFPSVLIGAATESLLIYYELKRRVHYVRFLAIEHHAYETRLLKATITFPLVFTSF